MTTADILTQAIKAASFVDEHSPAGIELKALRAALEEQIRTETAKQKGCTGATSVMLRMLKAASKEKREQLQYAWLDDSGRQLTCDGYRAFRLHDPLPLPVMPAHVKPFEIPKLFAEAINAERIPLDMPDVAELKARIAIAKADKTKGGALWDFGEGLPAVSAAYLLDLLSVLPGAKLSADKAMPYIGILYAEGDKGDALLLPVRTEEKQAEQKRKQALQAIRKLHNGNSATISLDDFAQIVDELCA